MCTESLRNLIFLHNKGSLCMGLLIILIVYIFYINIVLLLLAFSACTISRAYLVDLMHVVISMTCYVLKVRRELEYLLGNLCTTKDAYFTV